jgi:hypothetical protein
MELQNFVLRYCLLLSVVAVVVVVVVDVVVFVVIFLKTKYLDGSNFWNMFYIILCTTML